MAFCQVFLIANPIFSLAIDMALVPGQYGEFLLIFAEILAVFMAFICDKHAMPTDGHTDCFTAGIGYRLDFDGNLDFHSRCLWFQDDLQFPVVGILIRQRDKNTLTRYGCGYIDALIFVAVARFGADAEAACLFGHQFLRYDLAHLTT